MQGGEEQGLSVSYGGCSGSQEAAAWQGPPASWTMAVPDPHTLAQLPGSRGTAPRTAQPGTRPSAGVPRVPEAGRTRGILTGSAQQAGSARGGHLRLGVAGPEVRAIEGAWVLCLACRGGGDFCQHLQILQDNLGRKAEDEGQGPPQAAVARDRASSRRQGGVCRGRQARESGQVYGYDGAQNVLRRTELKRTQTVGRSDGRKEARSEAWRPAFGVKLPSRVLC